MYKLFRNVYKRKIDENIYALYNPLFNQKVVFVNENTYRILNSNDEVEIGNLDENTCKYLIDNKFLITKDFNEDIPILNICSTIYKQKPNIGILYLILTEACNYNCSYCFIEENMPIDKTYSKMSMKTCFDAIEYFLRINENENDPQVIFYGGEPLLNKEVFIAAVQNLRKAEADGVIKNLNITINTNASLVDKEVASICKKYNVNPAVSIDGYKELHDKCRKTNTGESAFDKTIKGYRLLQKNGANPNISCTINNVNAPYLEKITSYFINDLNLSGLGFNILVDFENSHNPNKVDISIITQKMVKSFQILREKGIYEDRLMRRLKPFYDQEIYFKDCGGYGNQIVVAPDGGFGPCHAFLGSRKYFNKSISKLNGYNIQDDKIFIEWNNRHPFNNDKCKKCHLVSICGGGCAYNAYTQTGDINSVDERICTHLKILFDWILSELWNNMSR